MSLETIAAVFVKIPWHIFATREVSPIDYRLIPPVDAPETEVGKFFAIPTKYPSGFPARFLEIITIHRDRSQCLVNPISHLG